MTMMEMIVMANAGIAFGLSQEFEVAVDAATLADSQGNKVFLEVFPGGEYRIIPGNSLGSLYEPPGVVIAVPPLGDDDWGDENTPRFYENARDIFLDKVQEILFNLDLD